MMRTPHFTHPSSTRFSLVEIVLALVVIAIGMVSVVSLFPLGLQSNRDSVMRHNAGDAAEQFFAHVRAELRSDWSLADAFPETKPTADDQDILWSSDTLVSDANIRIRFDAVNEGDAFDPATHNSGIFLLEQVTPNHAVDFTGVLRVWKEESIEEDPRLMGGTMPFGAMDHSGGTDPVAFGYVPGQTYTLKYSSGQSDGWGANQGNFGALAIGGTGASNYRDNIANGCGDIAVGDTLTSETGNMAGPTDQGIDARMPEQPYVRVFIVSPFRNGRCEVTVLGVLPFRLLEASGGGEVLAEYIGPAGGGGASGVSNTARQVMLAAEISWPQQVPYAQRQKTTFTTHIFAAGPAMAFAVGGSGGGEGPQETPETPELPGEGGEGGEVGDTGDENPGGETEAPPDAAICATCAGTGICTTCGGDGIERTAGRNYWSCSVCGDGRKNGIVGNGQCQVCGGDGQP